jgi:hypothetical protein
VDLVPDPLLLRKSDSAGNQVEKVKETFTDKLKGLSTDFCDNGIVKLVQRLDKCLNRNGDYVEK